MAVVLLIVVVAVLLVAVGSAGVSEPVVTTITPGNDSPAGNARYWIKTDPIGDQYRGDVVPVHSTTNLPVGDMVIVQIYSSSMHSTKSGRLGSSMIENVSVVAGENGLNRTAFTVDMSVFRPDEYLFDARSAEKPGAGSSWFFNVFEATHQHYRIKIDPVSDKKSGDQFTITATTNLPAGEEVTCEVRPLDWQLARADTILSEKVLVMTGVDGLNTTACDIDLSDFKSYELIVTESADKKAASSSLRFNVTDDSSSRPIPAKTQSSLSGITLFSAIAGTVLVRDVMRKKDGC